MSVRGRMSCGGDDAGARGRRRQPSTAGHLASGALPRSSRGDRRHVDLPVMQTAKRVCQASVRSLGSRDSILYSRYVETSPSTSGNSTPRQGSSCPPSRASRSSHASSRRITSTPRTTPSPARGSCCATGRARHRARGSSSFRGPTTGSRSPSGAAPTPPCQAREAAARAHPARHARARRRAPDAAPRDARRDASGLRRGDRRRGVRDRRATRRPVRRGRGRGPARATARTSTGSSASSSARARRRARAGRSSSARSTSRRPARSTPHTGRSPSCARASASS